jgi:hypothetical protein
MSWQPCDDPMPGDKLACDAIETVIVPRARDLGSFEVRRALPPTSVRWWALHLLRPDGPVEFLLGAAWTCVRTPISACRRSRTCSTARVSCTREMDGADPQRLSRGRTAPSPRPGGRIGEERMAADGLRNSSGRRPLRWLLIISTCAQSRDARQGSDGSNLEREEPKGRT